jgi:hypothetical protein
MTRWGIAACVLLAVLVLGSFWEVRERGRPAEPLAGSDSAPVTTPPLPTSVMALEVPPSPAARAREPTNAERARSLMSAFDLDPKLWDHYSNTPAATLEQELAELRTELDTLRGKSEAIHARADRALENGQPKATAGVARDLAPVQGARRKIAAQMMIAALAKHERLETSVP